MFRASKFLAVAFAVCTAGWIAAPLAVKAQEVQPKAGQAKEQSASFWMDRKLQLSQNLLAGISTGDFEKIAASAQAMRSLNKVEAFIRGRTPGYRTQLQIFDESLDEIIHQADRKNVEGAALGFTQLTISCVNCHKQLRAAK